MAENKTILIVDDDEDFRFLLGDYLKSEGYNVLAAESVAKANEIMAESKFDMAIVDLVLEDTDSGFVLSYHIKKKNPDMPVILVTAAPSEARLQFDTSSKEERSWIKADVILEKPIRFEQLDREIKRFLQN
jgi:two-component system, OmpR family, response regulator